jgi:hypothetical protein
MWTVLPPAARQKTLRLLSVLVLRHLPEPTACQGVKHDLH